MTINAWLDGSPYLFPTDQFGEERAADLLEEQYRLVERQQRVRVAFAVQAVELREELERDFDLRLVFESNAIEGVRTTFEETREFLAAADADFLSTFSFSQGVAADPHLLEVVGHGNALRFVKNLAGDLAGRPLREVDIRNVHKLAMAAEPRIAGKYKTMDNKIGGREEAYLTARADDVSSHVKQLVEWLGAARVHGPLAAAVVSAWLADIHPFDDGNGRVSRLVANYVLLRNDWPSLIIRSGPDRERYYEALAASDGGDIAPLFSLYVAGLHRTLSELEDPQFASSLLAGDLARQDHFDSWTAVHQRFNVLLQEAMTARGVEMEVVGFIGSADFAWLERRDAGGNGWWAKVSTSDRAMNVLLWFGYQSDELISSEPALKRTPSIFVSERDSSPRALHPYRPMWNDPRLSVHELSLQPSGRNGRAVIRCGSTTRSTTLPEAAKALAIAVAGLKAA